MLNRTDSLFVNYNPDLFGTYKTAGLMGDTSYGNYLDRALSGSATDSENNVVDEANTLGIVRSGPSSNIAGRYLSYLAGGTNDLNSSAQSKYGHTDPAGFKPSKPPTAGDLMRGWALANDLDNLL